MKPITATLDTHNLEVVKTQLQTENPPDLFRAQRDQIEPMVAQLEAERKTLFGVEQARNDQISDALHKLYSQKDQLTTQANFLDFGYRTWLSLEPLTWRDPETKLPLLALFDLLHSEVKFDQKWSSSMGENYYSGSWGMLPFLPHPLSDCYIDVGETMSTKARFKPRNMMRREVTCTLTASFQGTIPPDVRSNIMAAIESQAFEVVDSRSKTIHIYLLTEVTEWAVTFHATAKEIPVNLDPLVVGWTPAFPDRLWYIDAFDITPLENTIPLSSV